MPGKCYVAVDLGASSGRVVVGHVDGGNISLKVAHRFTVTSRVLSGHQRWTISELFEGVKTGLTKAAGTEGELISLGVDSWGVDYGLVDANGRLLEDPVCYRDQRTEGVVERVLETVPAIELFQLTGVQVLALNTVYQLVAQRDAGEWPANVSRLLMMPDLVHHDLCGSLTGEVTMASTTQLAGATTRRWECELFDRLDLPIAVMPDLVQPGVHLGRVRDDVRGALALPDMAVVAPATHDTASAVVGTPIGEGWAYLSSGTWSLLGIETEVPLLTDVAREVGLTNEGGLEGKNRLLKSIAGMWILESCRKIWATQGEAIDFTDLNRAIASVRARQAFVLPDDPRFFNPPDMPRAIEAFLRESGQPVPADYGGYARVVLESLALRYASVVEAIEHATGRAIVGIRIIGGGSQNRFLNQATADATGREVRAGPIEATALGNVIVQAISDGCFGNIGEAREAVARHMEDDVYEPTELEAWAEARAQYARLEREWGS